MAEVTARPVATGRIVQRSMRIVTSFKMGGCSKPQGQKATRQKW
jgi:hypothetical protein